MQTLDHSKYLAADLHWLAFLLTGRRRSSAAIAAAAVASQSGLNSYFSSSMASWARRLVISEALAAIRSELAASARRTEWKRRKRPALPARDWVLDRGTAKADLESALLAIDLFPRAALLFSVFEGVPSNLVVYMRLKGIVPPSSDR